MSQNEDTLGKYSYDGQGRRVRKLASGVVTLYHYDHAGNLIVETDGGGNLLRAHIYLNGERVAMRIYGDKAGMYYFLNDHLGTPQKIVDSAGNVVWEAAYLPFGEAQTLTGDIVNNFRFPGQYFDAETGLHHNWHRYYDPKTGRYLTPDPIMDGGTNLFIYALNDPANMTDPFGLDPVDPNTGERSEVMGCHHTDKLPEGAIGWLLIMVDIADIPSGEGIIPGMAMIIGKKGATGIVKLSGSQSKRITKIREIAHNWKVRKTLSGEILDSGHITKIQEGVAGLTKHRQALQNSLNNPNLSPETRKVIQEAIDIATDLIDRGSRLTE